MGQGSPRISRLHNTPVYLITPPLPSPLFVVCVDLWTEGTPLACNPTDLGVSATEFSRTSFQVGQVRISV